MKLQVGCVIYKFILLQTQLCITIFFTQACTGSCKLTWEDLKLLLDMHLGISKRSMHVNNSDIESIYPTSSNQHSLTVYPPHLNVYVWNVYISPHVYVPLFRSWCARLLPVLAAVSRQRSASRAGEKVRWRLIGAVSLSRCLSLSLLLVRGYSDVSCIALSLPRRLDANPRVGGAALRCARGSEYREREKTWTVTHTVKYTHSWWHIEEY